MTKYKEYKRIGIVGYPGCGKTTLAAQFDRPVVHTDDYLPLGHTAVPGAILSTLEGLHDGYVVEGTSVARLFERGWKPDLVIYMKGGNNRADCSSIRKMIDGKMKYCTTEMVYLDGWVDK